MKNILVKCTAGNYWVAMIMENGRIIKRRAAYNKKKAKRLLDEAIMRDIDHGN